VVHLQARNEIDAAAAAVHEASLSSILDGVTTVVCGTDDQAYGALLALDELGVDVPASMSVAGFNDLPLSRVVRPSLTTVALPAYELGRRGAELLLEASDARRRGLVPAPRRIEIATRLVPRFSTGPAPTSSDGGRPTARSCDQERHSADAR
jgi:LacI family transcriptional regulator